jgi:hypothetical protein
MIDSTSPEARDADLVAAARRVDHVVARLDEVIAESIRLGSRLGFFAAIYRGVTTAVRDAILAGTFEDGPRMAALDEIFASRYLDALERWRAGHPTSACWTVAFEASNDPTLAAIQHLVLGVNAHIGLDLGVAAATVAPGASLGLLRHDFDLINNVLDGLVNTDRLAFDSVSPGLAKFDRSRVVDELMARLALHVTRAEAWRVAERLADDNNISNAIAALDTAVADRARHIVRPDFAVRELLTRLVVPKERTDVGSAIGVLLSPTGHQPVSE